MIKSKDYIFALHLLFAFSIRLYHLDSQSIWWDEGHSIQMASARLTQIPTLPGIDVHPPGFFILLHLWMMVGGLSEFALRYLSLIFDILTLALIIRFGHALGSWRVAAWAGLLTALSPLYVTYAQEIRMYSLVTCFATASTYFLWQIVFQQGKTTQLIAYILTATLALYTHYFTLFLLCFHNLVWIIWVVSSFSLKSPPNQRNGVKFLWGTRGAILTWLASQLAILLLFSPQLWLASRQIADYANPNLQPPTVVHYVTHTWQAFTLSLSLDPTIAQPYLIIIAAILFLGLLRYVRQAPMIMILLWFLLPLALYYGILHYRPSYQPRYLMLCTPALFLILAFIVGQKGWLNALAGLVLSVILSVGLGHYFTNEAYFKDDAAAVARWLTEQTSPDDLVLVDVPHPFHYYADRIPATITYFFVDVHTAAGQLNDLVLGKGRLFWVTWWGSDTDPRGVMDFLLHKQAGPPVGTAQFRGYHLTEYALSERPFSLGLQGATPLDLQPISVNFDHQLQLDGLAYPPSLNQGEIAWATLHFSQLAPLEETYKISLRLRNSAGKILAQTDKLILNDRHFQTEAWPLDDPALNQAINVYLLPLTETNDRGRLTLEALVYQADTLAAIAAYGVPTTNDDFVSAQIGEIEVKE